MAQHQQPTDGSGHAAPQNEATSRLCVKNIPKYLDEKRLKEHFCAKGQVTDVKILKTRFAPLHCLLLYEQVLRHHTPHTCAVLQSYCCFACRRADICCLNSHSCRDGHSRQMAFVGYRSIEDATTAMKYFQNTYIDTSKLSIEVGSNSSSSSSNRQQL